MFRQRYSYFPGRHRFPAENAIVETSSQSWDGRFLPKTAFPNVGTSDFRLKLTFPKLGRAIFAQNCVSQSWDGRFLPKTAFPKVGTSDFCLKLRFPKLGRADFTQKMLCCGTLRHEIIRKCVSGNFRQPFFFLPQPVKFPENLLRLVKKTYFCIQKE